MGRQRKMHLETLLLTSFWAVSGSIRPPLHDSWKALESFQMFSARDESSVDWLVQTLRTPTSLNLLPGCGVRAPWGEGEASSSACPIPFLCDAEAGWSGSSSSFGRCQQPHPAPHTALQPSQPAASWCGAAPGGSISRCRRPENGEVQVKGFLQCGPG